MNINQYSLNSVLAHVPDSTEHRHLNIHDYHVRFGRSSYFPGFDFDIPDNEHMRTLILIPTLDVDSLTATRGCIPVWTGRNCCYSCCAPKPPRISGLKSPLMARITELDHITVATHIYLITLAISRNHARTQKHLILSGDSTYHRSLRKYIYCRTWDEALYTPTTN